MIEIAIAIVGSSALFTFIEFMIRRRDSKKGEMAAIKTELKSIKECCNDNKLGILREQLLILMNHYPDDMHQIFVVAEAYFVENNGDWYMSAIFNNFLKSKNIERPIWFKGENI